MEAGTPTIIAVIFLGLSALVLYLVRMRRSDRYKYKDIEEVPEVKDDSKPEESKELK